MRERPPVPPAEQPSEFTPEQKEKADKLSEAQEHLFQVGDILRELDTPNIESLRRLNSGFAALVDEEQFRLTDHEFQPKSDLARTDIVAGMEGLGYKLTDQKDD